jgi:hypothetical protein
MRQIAAAARLPTVQEIDRHKVAVADNALESVWIAALRFEKIFTNSEPLVGLSARRLVRPAGGT